MPGPNTTEASADEISALNELLAAHFAEKIANVKIRFDEPDPDSLPDTPTFHLFLYLIHEDLNIRHSSGRQYDAVKGAFLPEDAWIRCLYLVTYWGPKTSGGYDSPAALADSDAVKNINSMIRALLALRREKAFKNYQLRVIEPEALHSLGNFWQALNNKPRTIINFAVTLPVSLEYEDSTPPVSQTALTLEQGDSDWQFLLEQQLFVQLQRATEPGELARVTLHITRATSGNVRSEKDPQPLTVMLEGYAFTDVAVAIKTEAETWKGLKLPDAGNPRYVVKNIDTNGLKDVARPD